MAAEGTVRPIHPGAVSIGLRIIHEERKLVVDQYAFTSALGNLLIRAREIGLDGKPIGDAPDDCEIINLGHPEWLMAVT
jgi:hypothetical protein